MTIKNLFGRILSNKDNIDSASLTTKAKAFFRMVPLIWKGEYKANTKNLLVGILSIVYAISPIDLIPDFLPLFGIVDDFAVLMFGFNYIGNEIERFLEWEKEQSKLLLE